MDDLQSPARRRPAPHVTGRSKRGIEKQVAVTFFDHLPGMAVLQTRYRNDGEHTLDVTGWRNARP